MNTSKRTEPSVLSKFKRPFMMAAAGVGMFLTTSFQDAQAQEPVKNDTIPKTKTPVITGFGKLKIDSTNMVEKTKPIDLQNKKLTYGNPVQYDGYDAPKEKYDKSAKDPLWMSYIGVAGSTNNGNVGFNWGGVVPLSDWIVLNPEIQLTGARFGAEASFATQQRFPFGWEAYTSWSRQFSNAKFNVLGGPTRSLKDDGESFVKPGVVGTAIVFPGGYVNDLVQADFALGVGVMAGLKIADIGKAGSLMLSAKAEFMPLYLVNKYNWNYFVNNIWINSPNGNGQSPKREPYINIAAGIAFRFYDNDDTNLENGTYSSNAEAYQLAQEVKEEAAAIRQKQQKNTVIGQVTQVDYALYENKEGPAYLDWSKKEMDVELVPVMIFFQENAPTPSTIMSTKQGQFKTGLEGTVEKFKTATLKTEEHYSIK